MSENSKISWTDHTFNPWWGCKEVSPACDNCYARGFDKCVGGDHWNGTRRFFGDKHWNEPLKWNRDAIKDFGRHARVFCASMADVFEQRNELDPHRDRLFALIQKTPNLRWNLLTKRWDAIKYYCPFLSQQTNVRIGVTVENQTYDFRVVDGVSWLSCEPLLGPLSMRWAAWDRHQPHPRRVDQLPDVHRDGRVLAGSVDHLDGLRMLDWVIIGGESGPHAREMKLEWALNLIAECKEAGVAVHFKQTGDILARKLGLKDKSGKNPEEWPKELRIQEFPA